MKYNQLTSKLLASTATSSISLTPTIQIDGHGCGILCYRGTAFFVLIVITLLQFSNQMCRFLIITTSAEMQREQHWGPGDGSGTLYSILVGPAFIVVFTCSSIPLSIWLERKHRPRVLALCCAGWLLTTGSISYTQNYFQLLITRILLAITQAPVSALCISLLSDYFPKHFRSTAVSFFNLGIYLGYSATLGLGNVITESYNWRYTHIVTAVMGIPIFLLLFFIKDPTRGAMAEFDEIIIRPFTDFNLRIAVDRIRIIVKAQDKKWFFRKYHKCFLGSELIDAMLSIEYVNTREEGVEFAKRMYKHGYLYHVTKDHPFKDSNLFYRFTFDLGLKAKISVDVGERLGFQATTYIEKLARFRELIELKDRTYCGRLYKNCFIGKDTITKMIDSELVLTRDEAIVLVNQIMREGHIRHVTNDQAFKDNAYFYYLIPLNKIESPSLMQIYSRMSMWTNFCATVKYFMNDSSNWILILAGGLRYGAGYIWGQYSSLYYEIEMNQSKDQVARYLGWIPGVGGICGTLIGGLIADLAVAKFGVWARLVVVVASNVIAAPFALASLYMPVPYAYFALIPKYMASEMWMGVTLVVVTEMAPLELRATVVAVYLFFISIIGGNMPFMVEPFKNQFNMNLADTLAILFPGMYIISGILFTVAAILLRKQHLRKQNVPHKLIEKNFRQLSHNSIESLTRYISITNDSQEFSRCDSEI